MASVPGCSTTSLPLEISMKSTVASIINSTLKIGVSLISEQTIKMCNCFFHSIYWVEHFLHFPLTAILLLIFIWTMILTPGNNWGMAPCYHTVPFTQGSVCNGELTSIGAYNPGGILALEAPILGGPTTRLRHSKSLADRPPNRNFLFK